MTSSPIKATVGGGARVFLSRVFEYRVPVIMMIALFPGLMAPGVSHRAYAEDNSPTTLAPQSLKAPQTDDAGTGENGVTIDSGASDDAWSSPTKPPSDVIGAGDGSIEVNVLEKLGADMAGVLNGENGGFQPDLWRGTPRQTVDRLFTVMPVHTTSPAMRELMRRIFLTQAVPPEGNVEDGGFIASRLELLAGMGNVEAVRELLAVTPGRGTNERLIRTETDIHLLLGDFIHACALAGGTDRGTTTDYWQKVTIFCEVLSGAHAKAQLGLSLLREIGVEDSMYFLMLESMMASEVPIIEDMSSMSPLNIGILRASRTRLNLDAETPLSPAILAAIAGNPNLEMSERLVAAERAASTGVLSTEDLRALYDSASFDAETIANPLSAVDSLAGADARALLYQVVSSQTVDGAKAEAALLALETAQSADLYAITAQVFSGVIKQVPPRTDLIWFASHAVRALVIVGDIEAATGWLDMLRVNATLSDEAARSLALLVPVVQLTGLDDDHLFGPMVSVDVWREAQKNMPDSRDRAILYYSLLEGLGHPVNPAVWDDLGYGGDAIMIDSGVDGQAADLALNLPDPVLWHRLFGAARSGITGETVLLALATLGEQGTAKSHPLTISRVVQSLAVVGLEAEARALAVEAALAGGL